MTAPLRGQMTDQTNGQAAAQDAKVKASVVIPAFTFDRWDKIVKAVDAVQSQSRAPIELILCIDRNPDLLRACQERWGDKRFPVPIKVVANHNDWAPRVKTEGNSDGIARGYGGGSARNAGAEAAIGDVIVTFDDDAWPEPDCLDYLLAPYDEPSVVAVGGKTIPDFETRRPAWYPRSFDWIFGCAYEGLPTALAPTPRLIGANMSVRSSAFRALGGFTAVDFDDLDLCSRLAFEYPDSEVLYEPRAVAHHYVPAKRVTWRYFWTRSFLVNRDKVAAFATLGHAASLGPEVNFVIGSVRRQSAAALRGLVTGHPEELLQLGAMLAGIGLAGLGNLVGRLQLWREVPRPGRAHAG
jgi:cellulose synthase/poly-beta-1,6-N-acetylglucosamine synthase-like glycosyltransferase